MNRDHKIDIIQILSPAPSTASRITFSRFVWSGASEDSMTWDIPGILAISERRFDSRFESNTGANAEIARGVGDNLLHGCNYNISTDQY